jgi:hypothetical protein
VCGGVDLDHWAEQRDVSDLHPARVEDDAVEVEEPSIATERMTT